MTKEVIILIGINPATETVARHLGTDRQLVLADLLFDSPAPAAVATDPATGSAEGTTSAASTPAAPATAPAETAPRPAEALAKVLRRAGLKSRSTKVDLNSAESVQGLIAFAERLGEPRGAFLMDAAPGAAAPVAAIDLTATVTLLQALPPLPRVPAMPLATSAAAGPAAAPASSTAGTAPGTASAPGNAPAGASPGTGTGSAPSVAGTRAGTPAVTSGAGVPSSLAGSLAPTASPATATATAAAGTAGAAGAAAVAPTTTSASAATTPAPLPTGLTAGQQALIVCFSPTGNTETVAWMIQKYTNADVADLKPLMLYPRDYKNAMEQVQLENQLGYLPKLGRFDTDISPYPLIFIGFPVWDAQLPPPVKTWLKNSNLAGKTLVPFTTHAGGGAGESFVQIGQLCPDSTVLPGLTLIGNPDNNSSTNAIRGRAAAEAEKQVQQWLGTAPQS